MFRAPAQIGGAHQDLEESVYRCRSGAVYGYQDLIAVIFLKDVVVLYACSEGQDEGRGQGRYEGKVKVN